MEIGDPTLGYVVCVSMADGSFVGGALIVDSIGLPIEFRHTEPLSPSRLQRVLYGRALDAYMYNEVIIGALLDTVESSPSVIVVGDASYLAGATRQEAVAVWICEARNVPAKEIGARQDLSKEEYVLYLGPGNGPVRVRLAANAGGDAALDASAQVLIRASQTMELIEPLRRVDDALRLIADEMAPSREQAA